MISEGTALVEQALRSRRFGAYTLQAAISAIHARAGAAAQTDWNQIVVLYSVLQTNRFFADRGTQSGRRGRDAGRTGSGAGPDRCDSETRGTWWTFTVPTRHERSCAGAPEECPTQRTPMSEHYRWLGRNPSGDF